MVNKKTLSLMLIILILLPLLGSGCAAPATPEPVPPVVETPVETVVEVEEEDDGIYIAGEFVADKALYDAALAEGKLTYYTARFLYQEEAVVNAFKRAFPGIEVDLVRYPGGKLYEMILTEEAANRLTADVFLLTDIGLMTDLNERGLLAEHYPPAADKYPAEAKLEGYIYPPEMSFQVIAYNPELVDADEAPKDWEDLLDPRWKGKIGMVQAGAGGSTWAETYMTRKTFGVEYWEALAEQDPLIHTGALTFWRNLMSGEIEVGFGASQASYMDKVHMNAPIEWVFPPSGLPVFFTLMSIVEGGPNPNAAKLFMNWYLSRDAQTVLAQMTGSYSLREDTYPPAGLPGVEELNIFMPDQKEIVELREAWISEWNEIFGW